ncbi:LysR substrate-binding domain-containing protein [Actibacterium ureilyticum]|uniref:LysR substrate-binding domain-containing protein n=1 Tax=Actibacterium ureilyticum TaxID=1590614 RepID=UPI001FE5F968|nr:LysR substrate-binding domain-containing protein [Actibacterium ureilyticum]
MRLSTPSSFADKILPELLSQFTTEYPDIRVELLVSNVEANMTSRDADIALRVAHAPPEHLWGRRISSIQWAVYGSNAYVAAFGQPETREALRSHRLISPAGKLAAHPAYSALFTLDQARTDLRCDDLTSIAGLAAAGHGLALLPDDLARPDLVRLLGLTDIPPNSLWVLTHPDLKSIPRVSLLMGYLAKAVAASLRSA